MSFYDHFVDNPISSPSFLGKKKIDWRNKVFINLIRGNGFPALDLRLLEIGPGKGYFAKKCKEENIEYWAIEANKKMAENLRNKGFKNIYNSKVPPVKSKDGIRFDVIFMNQVFEHMGNQEKAIQLIKSCKRKIKKMDY